jgi:UDPglucose 6-dehydrogenase
MKICVYGLWHLGSVAAACLAERGFEVCGLDPEPKTVEALASGKAPLFEPGLGDLIAKGISSGRLSFSSDAGKALSGADFLWVAFDTPVDDKDRADVAYVAGKTLEAVRHLKRDGGVIISSQAPVGFVRSLELECARRYPEKNIVFACSPENLRLGKAIAVFSDPDRIIIGVRREEHISRFEPVFRKISPRLEWMRTESAEMTKHAINSFLAMSVVFANELAGICESVGADAAEVARGLKTEERIGPKAYVGPGTAFAGGTLARDINFVIETGERFSKSTRLFKAVNESNEAHKSWAKRKIKEVVGGLKGRKAAVLGLTYKPGTSTLRRSLSVELCGWLLSEGAAVIAYDPIAEPLPEPIASSVTRAGSLAEAVSGADLVILGTEHKEFQNPDPAALAGKPVIDPSGFLKKTVGNVSSVRYFCVGRGERL